MINRSQSMMYFGLIALGSAVIIGSALFSEYVLNMPPCGLCLRQRIGHYIAIPLALITVLAHTRPSSGARPAGMILSVAILAALLFSLYWSAFHIGVEQKWWPGLASCGGGTDTSTLTLEQLMNTPYVPCDQPTIIFKWAFGGLSMALAHALLLLPLTAFTGWVAFQTIKPAAK